MMGWVVCVQKEEAQAALINNNMDLRSAIGQSHCNMFMLNLGLYWICFWEIRLEQDFAGFLKQIRPELDFTI